ncbi:MAG: hypothetical protein LBL66_02595 [Clostridiales bacterium]|jgi:hypothetical protein|nr:hypothetical protein [Clostridiales bacterium]
MGKIRCTTCGDEMDSREMMSCRNCGTVMCPACAAGSHDMCNRCYSGLNYLS